MSKQKLFMLAVGAASLALAGCNAPSRPAASAPPPAASAPVVSTAMPISDEQACLRAVTAQTKNPDVVLLTGTETSEANNVVYIGVGPNRAKWRCLVKNARVAEVMSMTNEGRL